MRACQRASAQIRICFFAPIPTQHSHISNFDMQEEIVVTNTQAARTLVEADPAITRRVYSEAREEREPHRDHVIQTHQLNGRYLTTSKANDCSFITGVHAAQKAHIIPHSEGRKTFLVSDVSNLMCFVCALRTCGQAARSAEQRQIKDARDERALAAQGMASK